MSDVVSGSRADRLPGALLAYALGLAIFLLVPPYLRASVGPPAGFTQQEAADLFTPVVAIPLAWLVLDLTGRLDRRWLFAFLVVAAVWVEGQAIHLGTNAIGDAFPSGGAEAFYRTPPGDLDHWLDEGLSHWIWHAAFVAMVVLMLALGRRADPSRGRWAVPMAALAGLVYGAAFFIVTDEGVTTALGIPASLLLLGWSALETRRGPAGRAIVTFVLVGAVVTLIGYAGWAALHGGALPEFSKVGLFQ
jgi:hypothetical protein